MENKEQTKFYQQIPVGRELPQKNGDYHTSIGLIEYKRVDGFLLEKYDRETDEYYMQKVNPKFWLKSIPFMEIMIGFAEHCSNNYKRSQSGGWLPRDTTTTKVEYKIYTTEEVLTQYLIKEGIIKEEDI